MQDRRSQSAVDQYMALGEPIGGGKGAGGRVHRRGAAWPGQTQKKLEAVESWSDFGVPVGLAVLGLALVGPTVDWEKGAITASCAFFYAVMVGKSVGHRLVDRLSTPRMPLPGEVRSSSPLGATPEAVFEALCETEREVLLRGLDVGDRRTLALALRELIDLGLLRLSPPSHPPALRRGHFTSAGLRPPLKAVLSIFDALSREKGRAGGEVPLHVVVRRLLDCYHCYGFLKRDETYVFARLAVLPSLEAAGLCRREPMAVLGVPDAAQWRRTSEGDQVARTARSGSPWPPTSARPERRDGHVPQRTSPLAVIDAELEAGWTGMYQTSGE